MALLGFLEQRALLGNLVQMVLGRLVAGIHGAERCDDDHAYQPSNRRLAHHRPHRIRLRDNSCHIHYRTQDAPRISCCCRIALARPCCFHGSLCAKVSTQFCCRALNSSICRFLGRPCCTRNFGLAPLFFAVGAHRFRPRAFSFSTGVRTCRAPSGIRARASRSMCNSATSQWPSTTGCKA